MKRTVKKIDKQEYIIEEFNSYSELIKTNDSRESNWGDTRTDKDRKWRGATYDEAVQLLRYGWEDKEKVEMIKETISDLEKMQDVPKMSFKNDIVGYAPIVPLVLQGVPQNMINSTRKPKKAKVINLIVDISVSASTSVEEILKWGATVVAKVMNLEKRGFRVRIEIANVFSRDNWDTKVHAMRVLIKSENQPFDIKRMMFPIAHSAMFRVFGFDWYERLPEAQHFDGYGKSLIHHSDSHARAVKDVIADTKNSYYICNKEDINEILKGVA